MTNHYVRPEQSFTLEHIPEEPSLEIYATVEVWTEAAREFGNTDRMGWVSSITQPDEPEPERDGVTPLFAASLPLDEDNSDDIINILMDLGAVQSDDGSTIYATDAKVYDMASDETWAYTIHAHIRQQNPVTGEWTEDKVRILR